MRYEWRKIVTQRQLCALLLLVVMCNAMFFYRYCTRSTKGYTMRQIQEKYACAGTLENELNGLETQLRNGAVLESADYVTGNFYSELQLDRHVLERLTESREYESYRSSLVADAQVKLKLGLLGDGDGFSAKAVYRSMVAYERLTGTVSETSFSGGTELFTSFLLTDGLWLFFALIPSLWLLTGERASGLLALAQAAKHGRCRLYLWKFGAMLTVLTAGFVLLYGSNALIVTDLFGVENMAKPLQSVYGFRGCGYSLILGNFLALFLLLKYLWALCCGTIIFALCSGCRKAAVPICGIVCLAGTAAMLDGSTSMWLGTCSLLRLSQVQEFFQGQIYLDLLGIPVSQLAAAVVLLSVGTVASYCMGLCCFCRRPKGSAQRKRYTLLRPQQRTPHAFAWYEGYKLLIASGGGLLLALLLTAALAMTCVGGGAQALYEQRYRAYSEVLAGVPTAEKAAFLADESQRFAALQEKLAAAYQQYGKSADTNPAVRQLATELEAQEAFEQARCQYEALAPGQSYLYQTPYRTLFGADGRRMAYVQMVLYCLTLTLVFSRYFIMETESGVSVLHVTARASHTVQRQKLAWAGVFLPPAAAAALLPRLVSVMAVYGALDLTAQANSVDVLPALGDVWSVGDCLMACAVAFLLAGGSTLLVSVLTARRTGNAVMTLSLPLLVVLPTVWVVGRIV